MITLAQPSMAINDPRIWFAKYYMWNTWNISVNESREHIVDWVAAVAKKAPGGKLKNVVLNCHGQAAFMRLGQGFSTWDLALFSKWKGLVDTIWLQSCEVAFIRNALYDGNVYCSKLAQASGATVIAGTQTQMSLGTHPFGKIDEMEGLTLTYGPKGNVVSTSKNPPIYNL